MLVDVDREQAGRLGVSMQTVTDTLNDAFGQRQISTIYAQANQYRVILEAQPHYLQDPTALSKLYVTGATPANGTAPTAAQYRDRHDAMTNTSATPNAVTGSTQVPLAAFAQFDPHLGAARDRAPGAVPVGDDQLRSGAGLRAVRRGDADHQGRSRTIGMPTSVTGSYSGDAAEFAKSLAGEPWLILAAAITIYIVLGVLYESFIHPLTILSTLPSAGVGALLALMLFGYDLSVIALIGIVLLMGIVKKNAIMMIDFALEAEREQGLSPEQSIVQAALLRFRPIMMTTLAALFGALPLALEGGTGSELRNPLGITIVGGLLLSQLLTLYTTPVIYLYMERLRVRLSPLPPAMRRRERPARPSSPMNFSYPFIRRPIGTTLLAVGLFMVGATAYDFLPVASLPSVEFPDHQRLRQPPRRRSQHHGGDGRRAARAAARRNLRRHRTHLDVLARLLAHHHPVRPVAQHRRRRARRAGRAQCRADRPAGRHADAADLPQGQPGRGADPHPGADLEDHASRAPSTTPPTASSRSACRRSTASPMSPSPAPSSRPSACASIRRGLSAMGVNMEEVRTAICQFQFGRPARRLRRQGARHHHRHQRSAARTPRTTTRSS